MARAPKKKRVDEKSIQQLWERVATWLRESAPADVTLPEGASESDIEEAESQTGLKFPNDLRETYRLHNGSDRIWLFEQGYLMPLTKPTNLPRRKQALYSAIVDSWRAMNEIMNKGYFPKVTSSGSHSKQIKPLWWSSCWLPIVANKSGDHVCVDLDPARGGHIGQLLDWWHEQGPTKVLAKGLTDWLTMFVKDLESGKFRFDAASRALTRIRQ